MSSEASNRIYSLILFRWREEKPTILSQHMDVSSFSFVMRGTIREHIIFHSRLVCGRTALGCRQTVEFDRNLGVAFVYVHPSGLAGVVLSSKDYPMRVAFSLLSQALRTFDEKHAGAWQQQTTDVNLPFDEGRVMFEKFQNPMEADKLLKVQKDLDEVTDVMKKNLDDILKRGEQMEDLMSKTSDLSSASYEFYRRARQNNQCCSYLG